MKSADLLLHVGLPATGGRSLHAVLNALRPQLRRRGVAYARATDQVRAERRRTAGRPSRGQTLLMSDDTLLGPPLPRGADGWFPDATRAVADRIAGLQPANTTLALAVRRQDRALELAYADDILAGGSTDFEAWRAELSAPGPDYGELAGRLAALPGVDRLIVAPTEAIQADPAHSIDPVAGWLLGLAGLSEIDLSALPPATPRPGVTARGLEIARGMNREVQSEDERRLVRSFVLDSYAADPDEVQILDAAGRHAVLRTHAEQNRRFFTEWIVSAEPDLYRGDRTDHGDRPSHPEIPTGLESELDPARFGLSALGFRLADRTLSKSRRMRRVAARRLRIKGFRS